MANKKIKEYAYCFAGKFIHRFGSWNYTKHQAIQIGYRAGYLAGSCSSYKEKKRTKKRCPECGRTITVRVNGEFISHTPNSINNRKECPGSGSTKWHGGRLIKNEKMLIIS